MRLSDVIRVSVVKCGRERTCALFGNVHIFVLEILLATHIIMKGNELKLHQKISRVPGL